MQGFSARSYGLHDTPAYRTPDGRCITWRPSRVVQGHWAPRESWMLVGDGPLYKRFVELEIGEVREGYNKDFVLGVTGTKLETCHDISTPHDLDNTVLVSLSSRSLCTSL